MRVPRPSATAPGASRAQIQMTMNTKKPNIKQSIRDILKESPGITSPEIGERLKKLHGRKICHSSYLLFMTADGELKREAINKDKPGQMTYRYWFADESTAQVQTSAAAQVSSSHSPAVFATFSDGRAIVETSEARIELTAAEATQLRNMLNAAASN